MDGEGGGAVIPCKYILKCYDSSYNSVLENLKKSLDSEDLSGPLAQQICYSFVKYCLLICVFEINLYKSIFIVITCFSDFNLINFHTFLKSLILVISNPDKQDF